MNGPVTKRSLRPLALLALPLAAGLLVGQAAAPAPVRGGSLVVALNTEPPLLDPSQTTTQEAARMMYQNVVEGLVGLDVRGRIVPVLATALPTVSADSLTYTFRLRPNVKFHDGSDFTSEDVKVKFDRARTAGSGHTNIVFYRDIAAVETPNPTTVVFRLSKVNSEFLYNLSRPDSTITTGGTAEVWEANKNKPIGTGPFKVDAWNRGANLRLVRNPDYYVSSLPYLDSVTFRWMGADESAKLAALRSGDIDVIGYNLPPEQVASFRADSRFKVLVGSGSAEITVGLNNARKPFNDVRVRRAMQYALNKQEILQAFSGLGTAIGSHRSPSERYYVNLANQYQYDPERARRLLAEAGYAGGLTVKFTVTSTFPVERRIAEVYAAQLARVGVTAQIELVPFASWVSTVFTGKDFDMTIIGHSEPEDINIYANPGYYFGYDSQEFRDLYARALTTTDEAAKRALFTQMQRKLADDAVNVWAYSAPHIAAVRANVYGWWDNQPTPSMNVVRVFKTR